MQSKAANVTEYMEEVPKERIAALRQLRKLCLETLVGYDEGMAYGMPCYTKNGVGGVAFASQRNYISLYIPEGVVEQHRDALAAAKIKSGKVCINFPRPDRIPFDIVQAMLTDTAKSSEED
jgi:uncharacterized protein YdhG (YjbR/CyaY superfamily)